MPQKLADRLVSWASDLEPETERQARRTSELPFIAGHVALMPDAHLGKGATVGSVIPTEGAIIPAAVGVDIGCGMIAMRLDITSHQLPDDLDGLHARIARTIPSGVGKGHDRVTVDVFDVIGEPHTELTPQQRRTANEQFGTLGSGNHFVEVCLDTEDKVWLVLHSGSRGIGNQLAERHIAAAKGVMKEYLAQLPDPDLAYLVEGTPEFEAYIGDLLWAQDYAMGNRERMLDTLWRQVEAFLGRAVAPTLRVNCHHNYAARERHGDKHLWITRKGAIRAREGDLGVIPGSMGTRSYIVRGLGNPASYCSCSHGAGRRMSRNEAKRRLSYASLERAMAGKAWNRSRRLIDEHPAAYKDIDEVMEAQRDLVEVVAELRQILNYKGE